MLSYGIRYVLYLLRVYLRESDNENRNKVDDQKGNKKSDYIESEIEYYYSRSPLAFNTCTLSSFIVISFQS